MSGSSNIEIDPVKYGVLWEKVAGVEKKLDKIEANVDRLADRVDQLVEMANRSKGALWVVMTIVATGTAIITLLVRLVKGG